jgi:hypothetical protein
MHGTELADPSIPAVLTLSIIAKEIQRHLGIPDLQPDLNRNLHEIVFHETLSHICRQLGRWNEVMLCADHSGCHSEISKSACVCLACCLLKKTQAGQVM